MKEFIQSASCDEREEKKRKERVYEKRLLTLKL